MWIPLRVLAARVRGFLRPGDQEHEFDQELATHLAMAEEDKIRQGMTAQEARRQARVELGGLTQLREASRAARGLPWLGTLGLDVKLGFRMLRKSWGLTLIGGLAMSVAIGIGAVVFAFFDIGYSGTLPLDEGDRVVALQTWDERAHDGQPNSLLDFEHWRDAMRSVEDVGAVRTIERNLIVGDGLANPVPIAEITASGFDLARVAPFLGRPLTEEDEQPAAPPVAVIGYDVWQSRFAADPAILGRTIRFGATVHTVVGVMPQGFAFPVNHRFWIPLQTKPPNRLENERAFDLVFARLVPGATMESAQAELMALGLVPRETASDDEQLHPRVMPYAFAVFDDEPGQFRWMSRLVLFLVSLLLVPPCANIAILIHARTVTRQEEFAARFVLGASRSRIVVQIFVEVLVLAAVAAVVALGFVRLAIRQLKRDNPDVPFWIDFSLSFETVLFTAGLAVLAAMIAGAVPALRATGREMQSGLSSLGSGTGLRLGATWTALVVAQVAFSAAALPSAVEMAWGTVRTSVLGPGFASEEYLTARIAMDQEASVGAVADGTVAESMAADGEQLPIGSRFGNLQLELVRQLEAEPGVSSVTVAAAVPGDEPWATVEVEGDPIQDASIFAGNSMVQFNQIDDAYLDVFDVPLLLGRRFDARDHESERATIIVSRTFAELLIGDGNPLGHRVRYGWRDSDVAEALAASPSDPSASEAEASPSAVTPSATSPAEEVEAHTWYEIVGVVADLPANATHGKIYHPMVPGRVQSASLALRTGPTPDNLVDPLREIATKLDPTLILEDILPLNEIYRDHAVGNNMGATVLGLVTLCVLLLSGAGLYALMSFTVNQRRREIGIRSALGAPPQRLLAETFRRALGQVLAGALVGILVAFLVGHYFPIRFIGGWNVPGVVPAAAVFMILVGLLATAEPARRGLRVDPIEELRQG